MMDIGDEIKYGDDSPRCDEAAGFTGRPTISEMERAHRTSLIGNRCRKPPPNEQSSGAA